MISYMKRNPGFILQSWWTAVLREHGVIDDRHCSCMNRDHSSEEEEHYNVDISAKFKWFLKKFLRK